MLSSFPLLPAANSTFPIILTSSLFNFFLFYLTASLSIAEGQAGTAWEPAEQQLV
jgi:hypothetical protein